MTENNEDFEGYSINEKKPFSVSTQTNFIKQKVRESYFYIMKKIDPLLVTIFVVGMLVFGTVNTITTKYQDMRTVKGFGSKPPQDFNHPFVQTSFMFLGEFLICFVYWGYIIIVKIFGESKSEKELNNINKKNEEEQNNDNDNDNNEDNENDNEEKRLISKKREEREEKEAIEDKIIKTIFKPIIKKKKNKANPLIFAVTACCDLGATTLMNLGLFLTTGSVYQMLRGMSIVFVFGFGWVFLKRKFSYHHFFGVLTILFGSFVVGFSSVVFAAPTVQAARNPFLGDILIVLAQVLNGFQYVVEEKYFNIWEIQSFEVVMWEGYFGFSFVIVMLFVMYFIPGADFGSLEHMPSAIIQCLRDPVLAFNALLSIFSIAFFNFFSLQITKRVSSGARATINACRTLFIWMWGIIVGWENFQWLQIFGFFLIIVGTFLYNEILHVPYYYDWFLKEKVVSNVFMDYRKSIMDYYFYAEQQKKNKNKNKNIE